MPTSKTTETSLLIVFADIWLIVPPDRGSEVFRRSDRPFSVQQVWARVSDEELDGRWRMFTVLPHLTIPEEAFPMVVSLGLMNFT